MSDLYTASEARKKLGGIAPTSLQRLVDAGKVRKIVPPGNKKRGLYNKEDVDKLAEAMQEFIEVHALIPKSDKYEFTQAKSESDIKATVQIARQHFGDNAYGLEKRLSWFRKVPNGDYVLKHNGIIAGYFSTQGIKAESVDRIFKRNSGESVQLEDMVPIVPGIPVDCHVSGIGVKLGISRQQAKIYGRYLLIGMFNKLVELGRQGIDIRRIWVKSSTVPGIKLSQDMGLTELGYINNEQIGFVLDLETSEFFAAKNYREALKHATTETKGF